MMYMNLNKSLKIIKSCLPALLKSRLYGNPLWVHFYVTRRCNLNCKYCYLKDNMKKDISTIEIKKIIDKLYSLGIRAIAFFGGEPTLRKDFCEILSYTNKKGIFTFFTTNGILLNEDYVKRIAESGVDFIELSVDSIFEYDGSQKVYTKSRNVLELLIKYKKIYGFGLKTHLVLTKKNIDSAIKTINLIENYKIPLTIGYINRNTYNDLPEDESLYFNDKNSKKKLFKILDEIIFLKKKNALIMDPVVYFEGMKDYINGKIDWGCKAGKYSFSVDYDGSVQMCAGIKPYSDNILSIDRDYFKNKKQEINKTVKECMKKCYANCHFTTSYLIEHPIKALLGK